MPEICYLDFFTANAPAAATDAITARAIMPLSDVFAGAGHDCTSAKIFRRKRGICTGEIDIVTSEFTVFSVVTVADIGKSEIAVKAENGAVFALECFGLRGGFHCGPRDYDFIGVVAVCGRSAELNACFVGETEEVVSSFGSVGLGVEDHCPFIAEAA